MTRPITMTSLRFAYFPQTFDMEGVSYHVSSIKLSWQRDRNLFFRVLCDDGQRFDLKRDVKTDTWTCIRKV